MKTIKILTSLVCMFIAGINIEAQICNTPSPAPPAWLFNPSLRSSQSIPETYTLRVFIHIVRSNTGSGLNSNIISTMIAKLNMDYSSAGIQFQNAGNDFINNNIYYDELTEAEYPALYSTNSHDNAIDIYVLGTSTRTPTNGGGNALGVANSIPSTALWIHGNVYNTSVLSHEMGHCLGLYHTHHGTVTEKGDSQQCAELVNGSNAATCGDYIADTPADPNLWNGCTYNGGSAKDRNNQTYNPNPSNYMAYSNYTCWSLFTTQQRQRMQDFITNTPELRNTVIPVISGPEFVCANSISTFTISNLPTNASVSWSISPNLERISSANNSISIRKSRSSKTCFEEWVSASVAIGANTIPLLKQNIMVWDSGIQSSGINQVVMRGSVSPYGGEYALYHPLGSPLLGSNFSWSTTAPWYTASSQGYYFIFFEGDPSYMNGGTADVTVNFTDVCDCQSTIYRIFPFPSSYYCSPNPVHDQLTIGLKPEIRMNTNGVKSIFESLERNIRVYDIQGKLKKTHSVTGDKFEINMSDLPNGIYYVHIYDGKNSKPEIHKIIRE